MGLDEFAVLGDAIQHYGPEAQQIKAVEEMSELTKELCKRMAGADNVLQIAEEIADVRIMLDQLEMILCCAGRVKTYRAAKLRRLEQRIRDDSVEQAAWAACDPEEGPHQSAPLTASPCAGKPGPSAGKGGTPSVSFAATSLQEGGKKEAGV